MQNISDVVLSAIVKLQSLSFFERWCFFFSLREIPNVKLIYGLSLSVCWIAWIWRTCGIYLVIVQLSAERQELWQGQVTHDSSGFLCTQMGNNRYSPDVQLWLKATPKRSEFYSFLSYQVSFCVMNSTQIPEREIVRIRRCFIFYKTFFLFMNGWNLPGSAWSTTKCKTFRVFAFWVQRKESVF